AQRERRSTDYLIRERPESDGLAPLRHQEALVDRRSGEIVGVAGLGCLDGAGSDIEQRHHCARQGTKRWGRRSEADSQTRRRSCAKRERPRAEYLIRESPEGDGLAGLCGCAL